MAMPVNDDCNPAIAGAARRLRVASVSGSLQGYAQLAFDHGLDKTAHPITNHGFNRVEPIVEKIYSRISDRLRGIMLRGNALHGVVSYPGASTPDDFEVEHPGDYATFNSNQLRDRTRAYALEYCSHEAPTGALRLRQRHR